MGAMPFPFIMQLDNTTDASQCINLHVFMGSLVSSTKNFILGLFLETGKAVSIFKIISLPLSLIIIQMAGKK